MVSSKAATPEGYIAELPPERAALVRHVRALVNDALPDGYVERMNYGMISWELPLETYPDTYNKQPLGVAALAAQKNHTALYISCGSNGDERLRALYAAAGKKIDMGKSCLRFKKADQLEEEAIRTVIAETPPKKLIELYEASRAR